MNIVCCKTCHYSLANLTEHRCPECGNPFDPNDPSTFHPEKYKAPRTLPFLQVSGPLFALFAALALIDWFQGGTIELLGILYVSATGILALVLSVFHLAHFIVWKRRAKI